MVSLTKQIIDGLKETFRTREDEFNRVIVKEIYQPMPKGKYPKVTVEEIDNDEIVERTTTTGERTTLLSYQIVCYSRDMKPYNLVDSAKKIAEIVDDYMSENFKMKRITSNNNLKPFIYDPTVMTYTIRYSCIYDKETNLIYKYYRNSKYFKY